VVEDVGQYCRAIEAHLTRGNGGHLVRIVGPSFALVRQWYEDGIPLSVVMRGIDAKVERHRAGQARRPLRIEFCEPDVRHVFEHWRRAVGLALPRPTATPDEADAGTGDGASTADEPRRRPSLTKHLDRGIDRLSRAAGRVDLPEPLRDACARILGDLTAMRAEAPSARGAAARAQSAERLAALDAELAQVVVSSAPEAARDEVRREAERELHAFRDRLPPAHWDRSVVAGMDRLLRDRFGVPTLEL
jgi:hypothetical protein